MSGDPGASHDTAAPLPDAHVQVVRGTPDEDELAALVAGLVAAAAGRAPHEESPDDQARAARARWVAPGRLRGASLPTRGPDAWRWSLR